MIQYQNKLINEIDNFTLKTLPHSILLLGEVGSGHVDICKYISDRFNLQLYDLTEFISNEFIDEINASQTPSLYYVDMNKVGEREQNILLKLYEEPNALTYIVLNCESDDLIIDTIKSRSYQLKMSRYTTEQLNTFINQGNNELILKICTTPGQIEIANHTNIEGLFSLCNTMLSSMGKANYQNALSIANKINFKDEYDKYDLLLFIKCLKYTLLMSDIQNVVDLYKLVNSMSKRIWSMNNKSQYFEHFLTEFWEVFHS